MKFTCNYEMIMTLIYIHKRGGKRFNVITVIKYIDLFLNELHNHYSPRFRVVCYEFNVNCVSRIPTFKSV
jgi:hypothetical protein